jgi:hypothetical protein
VGLDRFLVVGVHQVLDALIVALTKGGAGSIYAVVKTLALDVAVLRWGLVPSFVVMVVIFGGLGVLGKQ